MKPGLLNLPGCERDLIAHIRARVPAAPAWLTVGIGDDAAVVQPERGALEILTTDGLVEDVHFDRRFSSPADVGWKALAVNLSDVAAMGGTPRLALLSLALPATLELHEIDSLLDGFLALAAEARVALAGGNITRSPGPLVVDVTVSGFARPRHVLTRSGARAGDELYVTGSVGAASAGLRWLKAAHARGRTRRPAATRWRPVPRVIAAPSRASGSARCSAATAPRRACMDLSDGLADGVRQIAEASGVGATIDASTLPIPPARAGIPRARRRRSDRSAMAGGDDYELLFAAPRRVRGRLATVLRQAPRRADHPHRRNHPRTRRLPAS